jgi:acetolactate synthase-1/2/3 large subunit
MNVSEYVTEFLYRAGVRNAFELSGGMIMHLLDAVERDGRLKLVNVYHEQAAAFAADAVGRMTGIPGVAFGTSGPGAINLLTGIGSAYFDSSPAVFITGQVNRHEQKGDRKIRQLGFQETDVVAMAAPITKAAWRITDASQVPDALENAFNLAVSGRPGSVLLDIPMDVFRSTVNEPVRDWVRPVEREEVRDEQSILEYAERLQAALRSAKRPLILAGAGVRAAGAELEFRRFCESTGLPVVWSLLACDLLGWDNPSAVGMIGTYGNRWANLSIAESDLLLVLGSRMDIRQTGADTKSFAEGRKIFHVDAEPGEINNRVIGCEGLACDLREFLKVAEKHIRCPQKPEWQKQIQQLRSRWPDTDELKDCKGINPNALMHQISANREPAAWCVDVGLHQMWAAQSLEIASGSRFLTSGGMGAMGFALPAAIGASFASGMQKPVVVIAGDGGFQLNIQELQSVIHHKLPIKIVVMNNRSHGMTRQFQDTYFGRRYAGTVWGYSTPFFSEIAISYGIKATRLTDSKDAVSIIEQFWQNPLEPHLLEVEIGLEVNAYPKLAFGRPISEMEPFAKPIEMEAT